jgi:kynurenine 3-monooxygenase
MSPPAAQVNVVGAGLAGALLALLLARRGLAVALYERRPDPRQVRPERGRSINLALAARGMRALEAAGALASVEPLMIPMRGRMIHDRDGATTLQPYGQRPHEVIYSVGRADLNRVLIDAAAKHAKVSVHFDQQCLGADPRSGQLAFRDGIHARDYAVPLAPAIATDGAGSAVRASLAAAGVLEVREEWLDHDYKELTIAAAAAETLERHALHIWPRGGFMLIALPNTDGSFTATLFLPRSGPQSFAALHSPQAAEEFFACEFPDAVPRLPDLAAQFSAHPQGQLGTVHAAPWHLAGDVLLLGDAAHAIVPFHGQGMNAAFEDCAQLDTLVETSVSWAELFARFEQARRANSAAIAQMALENYREMRDRVLDAAFVRRKALAMALERRFPRHFIPRYSMVMFHPEIPYSEALQRGAVQEQLLQELDAAGAGADSALAGQLVCARLAPVS